MRHAEKTNCPKKRQQESADTQQIPDDRALLLETIRETIPFRLEDYDWETEDDSHALNLLTEDVALNRKSKGEDDENHPL